MSEEKPDSEPIKLLDPKTGTLVESKQTAATTTACAAATELAVCHRTMPEIALEEDVTADRSSDAKAAVAEVEASHDRNFFSDTIVPLKEAVARRAYSIYVEQGSQPGHDAENWAKAEAQVDTRPK